jgi:hypothetical protein
MKVLYRGVIFRMPSLSIKSDAANIIENATAYMSGIATAPTKLAVNNEIGIAVTAIAHRSLSRFIDTEARLSPSSMHHVYEWNQVGKPLARLWKLNSTYKTGTISLSADFKQSRTFVPIKNGTSRRSKFIFKAEVMEKGKTVRITAKKADALFFYSSSGDPVFIPKGRFVVVRSPGGKQVRGAFGKTMDRFKFSNNLNIDIEASGIIKRLESAQRLAASQTILGLSGSSRSSMSAAAVSNTARHIRQVTKAYSLADGELIG